MTDLAEVVDDEDVALVPPTMPFAAGGLAAKSVPVVRGHGEFRMDMIDERRPSPIDPSSLGVRRGL